MEQDVTVSCNGINELYRYTDRVHTMSVSKLSGKFAILCAVWGLTWIAVKFGVTTLPPMLLAVLALVTAGVVFLSIVIWHRCSMRALAAVTLVPNLHCQLL